MTRVPFLSLDDLHERLRDEITRYFESFYDSGSYILGKGVEEFEEAYARFSGTRYCVGVANGFDAVYLALEALGIGDGTLGNWVRQARIDRGEREGLTTEEKAELARLRKENARLRMERDLLKRATAFWVKESGQ